jgi:site-specific recombinase XerD
MRLTLGQLVHSFFEDYLKVQKGLQPSSIRSYRDALLLFLCFVAKDEGRRLARLSIEHLSFDRVQRFLRHLEEARGNHVRTRNHRLAVLGTFFEYVASRVPEMLATTDRVAAIPVKRTHPPETQFLEREEVTALFRCLPSACRHATRDHALLLFLYNTGARAQEVADLRVGHLDLGPQPRVHLHGKGDKWRTCPLWGKTAGLLRRLIEEQRGSEGPQSPVFCSRPSIPLTRFGIYKIVRRHAGYLDKNGAHPRRVTPHLFRHTAAVHLLESGVEVNVIRAWLGHVHLETTNRYAELTVRIKEEALRACEPHSETSAALPRRAVWKDDKTLLAWLDSL